MECYTLEAAELSGSVQLPASKSHAHRLLIAHFLANDQQPALFFGEEAEADDLWATRACLEAMGTQNTPSTQSSLSTPGAQSIPTCNCQESGSTLRFLLPLACALGKPATFVGTGRLPARPLEPLLSLLVSHGATLSARELPLTVGGKLESGSYVLPGNISSQYLTGLLFALPLLEGESRITLSSPLESAGYVRLTLAVLQGFGITVEQCQDGYRVPGGQRFQPPVGVSLVPEPCYSSAAFWLVANALGARIQLNLPPRDSAQPDSVIRLLVQKMCGYDTACYGAEQDGRPAYGYDAGQDGRPAYGAQEKRQPANDPQEKWQLAPLDFDASAAPDLVPLMAVLMSVAQGTSHIYHAARLRLKESDRLAATAANLTALGACVTEQSDGLTIVGCGRLKGGTVQSFGDHRIAMAMAIAALASTGPVRLREPQVVGKSYPNFWQHYQQLGGRVRCS